MTSTEFLFRKASNIERETICEQISKNFGSKSLDMLNQKQLWIKEGKILEVFLVPDSISGYLEKLPAKIYSAGTPIGSLWGETFQIEIEGAYLLKKHTNKVIKIKTNQFLYGKPIFKENIEEILGEFDRDDFLVIMGQNDLHFGVGKAQIQSTIIEETPPNTIIVKGYRNKPFDRGWYLRKGN